MKKDEGISRVMKALRGVLAASAATVTGMAIFALIVIYLCPEPKTLTIMNQALKAASIILGTVVAVGVGGEKGLITGAVVGVLYILIGYALYCLTSGIGTDAAVFFAEEAAGAALGALSGTALANMKPIRRRRA